MVTKLTEHQKGIFSLVLLAFVFATMGIFARYLSNNFALFEQTYLRICFAFVIGVAVFAKDLHWKKLRTLPGRDWAVLIFRSIALYLAVTIFTEAILHTKYANASFISTLPFLPLFGYVFLKEKLSLKVLAYIGIGFVGAALITLVDFSHFKIGYGELMAFISMIAFDFSYIARRWHSDHFNNKESTVFMFAIGAVFLFITSIVRGEPLVAASNFSVTIILILIVAALFNVANLFLTNYGFQRVKVGIAGNILTLESVFALLYSIFLFGEIPFIKEYIGGALIILSVYLVNRHENSVS